MASPCPAATRHRPSSMATISRGSRVWSTCQGHRRWWWWEEGWVSSCWAGREGVGA